MKGRVFRSFAQIDRGIIRGYAERVQECAMDNGQLTMDNWEVGAAYGIRGGRVLRRAALNCGMLAPGKHVHLRFAARSTMLRTTDKI